MDSLVLLTSLAGAAAVTLITYGVWSAVSAERNRVAWRVSRTGIGARPRGQQSSDVNVRPRSSPIRPVDRALDRYSWAETARLQLEKAEINLYLAEFIAIRLFGTLAILTITLILVVAGSGLVVALVGLGVAAVFYWQFGAMVRRKINGRLAAVERNLDEALVNLAGSLRAGFSFLQACQMSTNQMPWPLDREFAEMLEEVNVGASLDDALRHMAERIESYEVDIAVNAVLVQRQVGGSLAEILENVAKTIRERRELRGQLMALTAQQRLSAYFVAGVPVAMAIFLSLVNWQFMKPLFTTTLGNILLVIGVVFDVLGFLVMRRLTRIDF